MITGPRALTANPLSMQMFPGTYPRASSSRSQLGASVDRTLLCLTCTRSSSAVRCCPPLSAAIVTHMVARSSDRASRWPNSHRPGRWSGAHLSSLHAWRMAASSARSLAICASRSAQCGHGGVTHQWIGQQKGEEAAIPPGWGSEYFDGMLREVMVVVLLGCAGLTAGVAFGTLFPSMSPAIASSDNRLTSALGSCCPPAAHFAHRI